VDQALPAGRSLSDYVRVLKRRWWIIVLSMFIGGGLALAYAKHQHPTYQGTSANLITPVQIPGNYSNISSPGERDPNRAVQDMAELTDSPAVAASAIKIANKQLAKARRPPYSGTPGSVLKACSVNPSTTSDLVTFKCVTPNTNTAAALANGWAIAFSEYFQHTQDLEVGALLGTAQQSALKAQLQGATPDATERAQLTQLVAEINQLNLLKTLHNGTGSPTLIARTATNAPQISPNINRDLAAGLGIGLIVGLGIVFLLDALDTRVSSSEDVAEYLGMPMLARVPSPPRKLRKANRLAMMTADPHNHSEAYRKLRVGLDFANLRPQAKTIMVTSSVEQEGKSTTVANLAVAMAQVGRKVVLVLRRPYLHHFFGLRDRPGVTEVILGRVSLDQALMQVAVTSGGAPQMNGNGGSQMHGEDEPASLEGVLYLLTAGDVPAEPASLLASDAMSALLAELGDKADVILIDTPPMLPVSDAMTISGKVGGVVVVARADLVRRPVLREMSRELANVNTERLGFILTGAEADASYNYAGYSYGYSRQTSSESGKASVS
jgi:polysaccharide biosynthesis transport protein